MRKWKPAADPRNQGAWLALSNFHPTPRGTYRTAPILVANGTATSVGGTPGTTIAALALPSTDGTVRTIVGTSTKLYGATASAFQSGSFTDLSKVGGYTASTWSVIQYGNITIAANKTDATQFRDATTANAFADLAGAPQAKILVVCALSVVAFNLSTAANSWAASDVGDYTNWTTGDAVTATPILDCPGEITAAIAFSDNVIIVFKKNSIYRMEYVGFPIYWRVDLIDEGRGVTAMHAVVKCGNVLIFSGEHGTTLFDGSGFRDLDDGFELNSGSLLAFTNAATAAVYLPTEKSAVFASAVDATVYNMTSDSWGNFGLYKNGESVSAGGYVLLQGPPSARLTAMGVSTRTISEAGLCFVNLSANPCVLKTDKAWTPHSSITASLTTSWMGDERTMTLWGRVTPLSANAENYATASATGLTMTGNLNDVPSTQGAMSVSSVTSSTATNRFDILKSSRFARFTPAVTGAFYEIADVAVDAKPAGTE